jgi:hypothetical protein
MPFGPLTCQYCGNSYMVAHSYRVEVSKFCSRSCRGSGPNPKKGRRGTEYLAPVGTRRRWKGMPGVVVKTDQGWEREHRAIATPRPGEIVHHRDGDPTNNDLENLEIMTQADHARLHMPERERDSRGRLV